MTLSKNQLLAVLAMDVYNRDGVGLKLTGGTIGPATIIARADLGIDRNTFEEWQRSGFYAVAYSIGGVDGLAPNSKAIAFRGTNGEFVDVIAWQQFIGSPYSTQGQQALQFYKAVNNGSLANNPSIVVTGHSLGGGLSGWVAGHTGATATAFDNIGFLEALQNKSLIDTAQYAAAYAAWLTNGGVAPAPPVPPIYGTTSAFHLHGEVAAATRTNASTPIYSYAGLANPVTLHSMALLTIYMNAPNDPAWQSFGPQLYSALRDAPVADALGAAFIGGDGSAVDKMNSAIAYSTVDVGAREARPFGDTGVRAMFDDAGDLGRAYQAGVSNPYLTSDGAKQALAKVAVQLAGDFATFVVLQADQPEAMSGAVALRNSETELRLNFDPALWQSTMSAGGGLNYRIVGRDELIELIRVKLVTEEPQAPSAASGAIEEWRHESLKYITLLVAQLDNRNAILSASGAAKAAFGREDGGAILIGSVGGDQLFGGKGDDLLIGGKGSDEFFWTGGKDLLFGGDDDDAFYGSTLGNARTADDRVIFFGGLGTNRADYGNVTGQGVRIENKASVAGQQVRGVDKNDPVWTVTYKTTGSQDILIDVLRPTGSGFEDEFDLRTFFQQAGQALFGGLTQLLDLGGQKAATSAASSVGAAASAQQTAEQSGGDVVDGSALEAAGGGEQGGEGGGAAGPLRGQVFDFSDPARQFIADYATPLPGDIEKLKGFPKNTFEAAAKVDLIIRVLGAPDPLIDTYARDTRLDLANAESIIATRFDDVIFGTDEVYDWVTPPPPADAPPNTPPPAPQWQVDRSFSGYRIDAGKGDDIVLVRNGSVEQKLFDLIDGGDGDDVIVARGSLGGEIKGGKGNDVLVAGRGQGVDIYGGDGDDLILNYSKGRIYGDAVDTAPGTGGKDKFWWAPGAFLMDAEVHDRLYFMGIPLTGGSNLYSGLYMIADGQVRDWIFPFVTYGAAASGNGKAQLLVGFGNISPAMSQEELLAKTMDVQNFNFAQGGAEFSLGQCAYSGDLGMALTANAVFALAA